MVEELGWGEDRHVRFIQRGEVVVAGDEHICVAGSVERDEVFVFRVACHRRDIFGMGAMLISPGVQQQVGRAGTSSAWPPETASQSCRWTPT